VERVAGVLDIGNVVDIGQVNDLIARGTNDRIEQYSTTELKPAGR
jgi:hypothetical protein